MRAVDRETLAGQTLGQVDLVAVDQVLLGIPTVLTDAEHAHLDKCLTGSWDQADDVGRALGISRKAVLKRHLRAQAAQRAAPS